MNTAGRVSWEQGGGSEEGSGGQRGFQEGVASMVGPQSQTLYIYLLGCGPKRLKTTGLDSEETTERGMKMGKFHILQAWLQLERRDYWEVKVT